MTRAELVERLEQLRQRKGDPEADHTSADQALLDYINDPEVTYLYDAIEKWYA